MVALHQRFETSLDVFDRRTGIKPERIECLALDIVHGAGLTPALAAARAAWPPELAEHAEGIVGSGDFRVEAGGTGTRRRPSAVHAHLPGRAMADDGFFLIFGD